MPRWDVGQCALDADGFTVLVVDGINRGQLHEHRFAVAHRKLQLAAAADDLLGRNAIDPLCKGRMNSMPPPETMKVLKPLARR